MTLDRRLLWTAVTSVAMYASGGCSTRTPAGSPGVGATAPLITIDGTFDPSAGRPQLVLAPQIRCDGSAVLVALARTYGDSGWPVSAAIIDRATATSTALDLDAIIAGTFDERDPAAVQRKVAAANAKLATECWRPLAVATVQTDAVWRAPTLTVIHRGATVEVARPDLAKARAPDDDCVPTDQVDDILVDDELHVALVGIGHVMHDNCGSDPPAWVVVTLPASPPSTAAAMFACGQPTQAAFVTAAEHLRVNAQPDTDLEFGSCRARLEGDSLTVRHGATTIYESKEAGATWVYDPAFADGAVRPGDDAGAAATAAAGRGNPVIRCQVLGDSSGLDECNFRPAKAAADSCSDGTYILIRHDAALDPESIHDAAALRGHAVIGVALGGMPC